MMLDQLVETWFINNRVNLRLLEGLDHEGLNMGLWEWSKI